MAECGVEASAAHRTRSQTSRTGSLIAAVVVGTLALAAGAAYGLPGGLRPPISAEPTHLAATGNMQIGTNGLQLIEEFEGLRLTDYRLGDGMCTIGYGHALPLAQCPPEGTWTITQAEAEAFLATDVQVYGQMVNDYFTRTFNQNQFDALVAFTYNLGAVFVQYEWPKDPPDSYFPGIMMLFVNPPQFREGLTRRREAEVALFENPVMAPPRATPSPTPSPSASPTATRRPSPTPTRRPSTPTPTPTRTSPNGDFQGGTGAR